MTHAPVISVDHLTVFYPNAELPALSDISLTVGSGELIGLIGPNGAGKSTLARHLAGLRKPKHGRIAIGGRDASSARTGSFASDVGFVFQNPDAHLTERSVRDELLVGPQRIGLPLHEAEARAADALDLLHLRKHEHRHPMLLDLAHRRLVALASALTLDPAVLLLDEPTAGLDADATTLVTDVIQERNQRGQTTIIISHDLNLIAELTNRTVLLHRGQIIADGPTERVLTDAPALAKAGLDMPDAARLAHDLGLSTEKNSIVTVSQITSALLDRMRVESSTGGG